MTNLKAYCPKNGEGVVVVWKSDDGVASGGTEGFVLGIAGDEFSGGYLVLDRSTYQDSFKSDILSLDILDLQVIPLKYVKSMEKTDSRMRPPGTNEHFNLKMEADYRSNIDFNSTFIELQKRADCRAEPIRKSQSEAEYGLKIERIRALEGVSINISAEGTIQIFCSNKELDNCIRWIQEAVELLPGHKRLVMFPTKITFRINDTYKEEARPTEEIIDRIARVEEGPPVVFPIGWSHRFFVELDANPLQGFFPGCQPLESLVIKEKERKEDIAKYPTITEETEPEQPVDLQSPSSGVNVTRYLGAVSPTIRLRGVMKDSSPKYEEYLISRWLEMRSGPWQWFSSDVVSGKMTVRDLYINKKARIWKLDLGKYSCSTAEPV